MDFIPVYIFVLASTIIIDYFAGILIERSQGRAREICLLTSILFTAAILFFFKYYDFVAWNITWLSQRMGASFSVHALSLVLPIGLSFHTFQSLSYVIEVYRGNVKAERHFGIYALYVMFYPQLVAGPIERPQNLLHQFHESRSPSYDGISSGLRLMAWGLIKKCVIADRLAKFVGPVYHNPGAYDGGVNMLATFFFAFQIYGDFSGYSDLARGAARVLGFDLMLNFDRPYCAASLGEFWRRWHISLSTWLRDYIYEPIAMGLRERGIYAVLFALMVTFLFSGLWHGANWTFIIWGGLYGIGLSLEALTMRQRKRLAKRLPTWLFKTIMIAITFAFVNFCYIWFRAESVHSAIVSIHQILRWFFPLHRFFGEHLPSLVHGQISMPLDGYFVEVSLLLIVALLVAEYVQANHRLLERMLSSPWFVRWPIYQVAVFAIAVMGVWLEKKSFIYFQF